MAEEWNSSGWNYDDLDLHAEYVTGEEWSVEEVFEVVPEARYLVEENDGMVFQDYMDYFVEKFDERVLN